MQRTCGWWRGVGAAPVVARRVFFRKPSRWPPLSLAVPQQSRPFRRDDVATLRVTACVPHLTCCCFRLRPALFLFCCWRVRRAIRSGMQTNVHIDTKNLRPSPEHRIKGQNKRALEVSLTYFLPSFFTFFLFNFFKFGS